MEHTPTPWIFDEDNTGQVFGTNCGIYALPGGEGSFLSFTVANVPCDINEWQANAAFIVKAVNSFDKMQAMIVKLALNTKRTDLQDEAEALLKELQ